MSSPQKSEVISGFSSSSDSSIDVLPSSINTASASKTTPDEISFLGSAKRRLQEATHSVIEKAGKTIIGRRRLRYGNSFDDENCRSSSTSPKSTPTTVALPGEAELETLMNVAEYEIHQDPYRGIMSQQQSLEIQTSITTPWNACEWGTLPPEPIENPAIDLTDPQIVVRHVGNCACPSMKDWTKTIIAERMKKSNNNNKKRKRNSKSKDEPQDSESSELAGLFTVGVRPQGDNFVCPCDFNPLCLASLGGVINEVIKERCQALDATLPQQEPSKPKSLDGFLQKKITTRGGKEDDGDAEVEVIESPQPKRRKESLSKSEDVLMVDIEKEESSRKFRDPALDDSSADTFAFPEDNSRTPTKEQYTKEEKQALNTPLLKARESSQLDENPALFFLSSDIPQQDLNCIKYSSSTNEALQRTRRSIVVESAGIRSYIHRTLGIEPSFDKDNDGLTIDRYMKILRDWNERLQFMNPVSDTKAISGDQISLSMPPGIRNLGATCYLNTQLQCLAQNLTFLNGIFSWRMVDEHHMMNSVMTKLQLLLAQMFLGGERKLTTLDFSNALGLEHNEQQDPNEFARLLFDRMEESFQQCDNDGDLSNLLNRIFHGVTTYETICMTCGHASERSESFMDLNLPIVKRTKEPKKKSGTIQEAFGFCTAKNVDTDVQYCLNQYTCAEMLDGENQYHCDSCNGKRDAKRVLKLTELPPVLNVQLSRYVYDRTKGEKKKVSDKVLLPTSLDVQTGGVKKKKYLLCAVMRHQGTSAYSGHYLAEAMDWLTGKWFEFNDETVKLLPDGPSSSFDPNGATEKSTSGSAIGADTEQARKSEPSGSQDAYNMYYVEEDYLSRTSKSAILWREKLCKDGPNAGEVLDDVTDTRKEEFMKLSEMCLADARTSERLNRRKVGIRKYMLPDAQSLVRSKSLPGREIGAWVPTEFLRRYLECQADMKIDSLLDSPSPVLQNSLRLCEHKRLSPKAARTGKLLPFPLYHALISLLRGERAWYFQDFDENEIEKYEIEDCKIIPSNNLICDDCSKTHRDQLSERLDLLRAAKDLYDALDTKNPDAPVYFEEDEDLKSDEEMYVYVISRHTTTKFRRRVAAAMKSIAKYEGGGKVDHTASSSRISVYEGLGEIDISSIIQHTAPTAKSDNSTATEASPSTDILDKYFNSNITCTHGNCNFMYNRRQVRYVSHRVWLLIKKLFPDAIEHKRKRERKRDVKEADTNDQDCHICRAEEASVLHLKDAIKVWASRTREDVMLKALLDGKRTLSREQEVSNFVAATNDCRLVHKSDIRTWREAVKLLSNAQKIKGDSCDAVRSFTENLVFPSFHAVVLDFENQPIDKLVASIRSFICREHHKVVRQAILGDVSTSDENELRKLADYITVVGNDEYHGYISSLAAILRILRVDNSTGRNFMESPIAIDEEKAYIKQVREVTSSHHPLIRNYRKDEASEDETQNTIKFTHDGSVKEFNLFPSLCDNDTCRRECAPLQDFKKEKDDERIESISVDSLDTKPSAKKSDKNRGSGISDPILVESDLEDDTKDGSFVFRVFELKPEANTEQALNSLQSISAIPVDFEGNNDLRRSSRKRKGKYPCGVILSEDTVKIGLYHNFAAICLSMYEQASISTDYSKLFLVLTPEFEKPLIQEASPSGPNSELTLEDKIQEMRNGQPNEGTFDPTKHALLLYQKDPSTSGDASLQQSLLESLFHFANFGPRGDGKKKDAAPTAPTKKKSRPSERGFRGTLLSGAPPAPAPSSTGDDDSVIQGHPEAPAVSGEDNNPPRPCMVVEDVSPQSSRRSSIDKNQMVLSDDDDTNNGTEDDEAILRRSLMFPKNTMESPPTKASSSSSSAAAAAETATSTTTVVDPSIIDCEDADRAKLSQRVFEKLEKSVDAKSANPSRMWEAMHSALNQFPDMIDEDILLDVALAKYNMEN